MNVNEVLESTLSPGMYMNLQMPLRAPKKAELTCDIQMAQHVDVRSNSSVKQLK